MDSEGIVGSSVRRYSKGCFSARFRTYSRALMVCVFFRVGVWKKACGCWRTGQTTKMWSRSGLESRPTSNHFAVELPGVHDTEDDSYHSTVDHRDVWLAAPADRWCLQDNYYCLFDFRRAGVHPALVGSGGLYRHYISVVAVFGWKYTVTFRSMFVELTRCIFTARCTSVQSVVLRSHVVRLSASLG